MGLAQFMIGDNDAAIAWYLKALDKNPGQYWSQAELAMAYALNGDRPRSRDAVAAVLRSEPGFNLSKYQSRKIESFPPARRKYWDTKLLPAWRLAGLPR